jgi:vacuolar-type H+-ATPase subunit I/STV1
LQRFIEVETTFAHRHRGQLCRYWNIKKNDTDVHQLRYNNQTENPLLGYQGWNEFKDHHDLPDNVIVTFTYHGNNFFEVSETEEIICSNQIPPFHSRSLDPAKTTYFDVQLADVQVNVPKLVSQYHKITV